jgi:NO-binding membrane sensor protein with MHYT domain
MSFTTIIALSPEAAAAQHWQAVWNGLAIGAALLVVVALLAFRRTRAPDMRTQSRLRRIVETAGVWSLGYTAMQAPAASFGSGGPIDLLLGFALFMLLALALVGAADFLLDVAAPRSGGGRHF